MRLIESWSENCLFLVSLLFTLSLSKYQIISRNISVSRFEKTVFAFDVLESYDKKKMCFNTRCDTIAAKFIKSADITCLYLTIFYFSFVFFICPKLNELCEMEMINIEKLNAATQLKIAWLKIKIRWRNDTYISKKIRTNNIHIRWKTELCIISKEKKNNLKLPSNRQSSANRQKNRSTMSNGILYFVWFLFLFSSSFISKTSFHPMKISENNRLLHIFQFDGVLGSVVTYAFKGEQQKEGKNRKNSKHL